MKTYLLRRIDPELWAKVKAKAKAQRTEIRKVILAMLERWVE